MSVAAEPRRPPDGGAPTARCERCGARLAPDQEWCLDCGSARTVIHRAPDWRIAAAIVGTVLALVLAGFAIALINLSSEANRSASTSATAAPPAPTTSTPAATTNTKTKVTGNATAVSDWPIGLPGWTVVLFTGTNRQLAVLAAKRLTASGLHVGILNTSQHPSSSMRPGHFAVFVGRYPTRAAAQARANVLHGRGFRSRARLVGRPGSR